MSLSINRSAAPSFPGRVLTCLGVFALLSFLSWLGCSSTPSDPPPPDDAIAIPLPRPGQTATEAVDIFEKLHFQRVHQDLQHSYLTLIDKINDPNITSVDVKSQRSMYVRYQAAQNKYQDTIRKVVDLQKDQKLKCFSMMKSLVRGIVFYDQKVGKKLTRFDPDQLLREHIFSTIPSCPENGTYTIIVRNERRFFHCSIHGILRN